MRSAMFFESDLRTAAETAAFAMEEHGLTPDEVQALADQIGDVIREHFRAVRDRSSCTACMRGIDHDH